jgi:hypothetical protein
MMSKRLSITTTTLFFALGFAAACGDDDTGGEASGPTSSSSATGGGTPTGTGGGGQGGTGTGGTPTGTGGGPAQTCDSYCDVIMANCSEENAQYSSVESCLGACANFPAGTAADQSGDTLGCRIYHAGAALSIGTEHCVHAGPGGDGLCGTNCEGFCSIATAICPAEWSAETCDAMCAGIGDDVAYSASVASGDSLACRLYHLTVAATDAASATEHCPHTVAETMAGDPCF